MMQNQNLHPWSWGQGSAPPFPTGQGILPGAFPPTGVDQNSLLAGYHQMYGNPPVQPPPEYGQWTSTQLQQWQQWQQWQEKYQQWQAQYGKKYAESLAAMGQSPNVLVPGVPPVMGVPKPLKPSNSGASDPPLPTNSQPVPPPPPDEEKPPLPVALGNEGNDGLKNEILEMKDNPEELSEAEKVFDVQFKQWEGQFNAWKKENQDHPDKAQYKEYEKKWEAWREQLLQRREQMRKKRLSQAMESGNEGVHLSGKVEDSRGKPTTSTLPQTKSSDSEYGYRSRTPCMQGFFPGDSCKFDKPIFEKPLPTVNQGTAASVNSRLSSENEKNLNRSLFPSVNVGGFGGPQDNNRNQVSFGNFANNTPKVQHQAQNYKFGNFRSAAHEENFNLRFRNQNYFDGARFTGGKFDKFANEDRSAENFCVSQRFGSEKFETLRNEEDFGQQRFFDNNRDKELGSHSYRKNDLDVLGRVNNSQNFTYCPSENSNKPKVPSLFDVLVEKPPGLMESNNDWKSRPWEKSEKECYSENRGKERENERSFGGFSRIKPGGSPWMQPWELEKMNSQKAQEARVRDKIVGPKDSGPWMKDISGKQEIDKAELSGYVGNILAKLGHYNMTLPGLGKIESNESLQVGSLEKNDGGNTQQSGDMENSTAFGEKHNDKQMQETNRSFENRDKQFGSLIQESFSSLNETRDKIQEPPGLCNNQNCEEPQKERQSLHLDMDTNRFRHEEDRDDRVTSQKDDKMSFGRDNPRNFTKPVGRDGRRNFGNEERFFNKDFSRPGKDERSFGRFNPRDEIDDRFGCNRMGRRCFDEREGGRFGERQLGGWTGDGPFDRFNRGLEQPLNEPVWKPQVFDYSQGRPLRLSDPEEGFKISTVVDYSHGENKQTFDYGHGETGGNRNEIKFFDYSHRTEVPTVIDYGHGFDKAKEARKDKNKDSELDTDYKIKNSDSQSYIRRSRSPAKGPLRSRSRSPHFKYKKSSASPPYKGEKSRNKEGSGRQVMKRDRRGSEEKLSPGEGDVSKHSFDVTTVLVEDLICKPGRESRPNKLVFIMRGIPGSGKTYVTKLIKDKEIELGGDPPRILSLDDYFMTEVEKEIVDDDTGRKMKTKVLEYEYEAGVEPHYRGSLVKAFKKTISDGFFSFVIVDSVNEKTKDYEEMWSFAKQKGFQVYVAEMDNDVTVCTARNIHKRTEKEIAELAGAWEETPPHYLRLDVRSLLQSDAITEVEMEVVSDTELEKTIGKEQDQEKNEETKKKDEDVDEHKENKEEEDEDDPGVSTFVKSRWDQFENSEQNLDRLDGLKRRREGFHATMEDYLQLPDDVEEHSTETVPGKKKVRWADLEERRQQEKMRAIGFVVGQTDWSRMTDPTFGESALTRTKYI